MKRSSDLFDYAFIASIVILLLAFVISLSSCSKVTTPERAARYGARCGQHL